VNEHPEKNVWPQPQRDLAAILRLVKDAQRHGLRVRPIDVTGFTPVEAVTVAVEAGLACTELSKGGLIITQEIA
jgi:hypothetical protein